MKVVITGASGLLGWHTAARLHAENCAARFRGQAPRYDLQLVDRARFSDAGALADAVVGADAVIHFAGVNRGTDEEVSQGNLQIARALVKALDASRTRPHIVYANSIQSRFDNAYGRSKREAALLLAEAGQLTDLMLPHIFGECARPDYNNVTATLIDRLWNGERPVIHEGAAVSLLHAGTAANIAIAAASRRTVGQLAPAGTQMDVMALWCKLQSFHVDYAANIFPALDDPFDTALFNCYRTAGFPDHYPRAMSLRNDARGRLFESSKARSGSQTFVSTTAPGQVRGDHFHLGLVERFLVVAGEATIRVRRVLTDQVVEFRVSGHNPVAIDMPPLHTHHLVNDSKGEVITFFYASRLFDPNNPDTYADPVLNREDNH